MRLFALSPPAAATFGLAYLRRRLYYCRCRQPPGFGPRVHREHDRESCVPGVRNRRSTGLLRHEIVHGFNRLHAWRGGRGALPPPGDVCWSGSGLPYAEALDRRSAVCMWYRIGRLCFGGARAVSSSWTRVTKRLVRARKLKNLEQRSEI